MTHINAFQAEVEEKKQALQVAQGALSEAEAALKSHPDYEAPKVEKKAAPKVSSVRDSKGHFLKK